MTITSETIIGRVNPALLQKADKAKASDQSADNEFGFAVSRVQPRWCKARHGVDYSVPIRHTASSEKSFRKPMALMALVIQRWRG